jgi:hypothetical protein
MAPIGRAKQDSLADHHAESVCQNVR